MRFLPSSQENFKRQLIRMGCRSKRRLQLRNFAILIEQTYEKGVLTFYYAYHDLNKDKGEDL